MDTHPAQPSRPAPSAPAPQDPAELARRELVEWCRKHELPVPADPRAQSSAR